MNSHLVKMLSQATDKFSKLHGEVLFESTKVSNGIADVMNRAISLREDIDNPKMDSIQVNRSEELLQIKMDEIALKASKLREYLDNFIRLTGGVEDTLNNIPYEEE